MKDCTFCKNAYTDEELNHDNDLSYLKIGETDEGYRALMRTGDKKATALLVEKGNQLIWAWYPHYCPVCGRELKENEFWRKN